MECNWRRIGHVAVLVQVCPAADPVRIECHEALGPTGQLHG